ncbi:MAG: RNA polymerase subunit sigma [Bacteroidetes bacterium 4572_112]|nr:MAG: RNA polymerase subunit sigma [Bacteroidetes bacterium 4572_112]
MIYTDDQIIELCRSSRTRERGFRILLSQYKERIYWHIRRILYDHDDANDVVQNVFIKVWKSLDSFRGDSKLYSWIYRIATNESLNYIRKMKKHKGTSIDDVEFLLSAPDTNELMTGDVIEQKLYKALATLPEKQRLAFNMKYFDHLKYKEIAAILGVSEGTLKANYFHAVRKIEKLLTDD